MRFTLPFALALLLAPAALGQQHVAPTEAMSPADERKAFTVPAGFEVQLVAAEPDIGKPIQMAFDAKGRLWVTTSRHYPFAAEAGKASDKLYVLSDFGPDGKAGTVQVFDDHLNIPIGILPLPDGKSCIVSSLGEIRKLTDTDGDGKADKMEVLYSGFGTKDTHGMYNSFTLLPDGWVYACHGFSNDSTVKGKDGHEVKMQSGNTFRFRPDGSRIEVYTRGQVNPFGMAVDPWLNLYTADCHSKPITQLIPGAVYQSFGKPHDGLGYAPHVTTHDHGSTALCGLTWYAADHFPKEYRGCLFLGNVVTNRINFDRIEWKGSTPVAKELPDFLTCKDPWFRPSDIKLGPDGALYVADFYNRIIGHYEIDLKHPLRDKDRGRVWRVVWKGKDGKADAPKAPFTDLTTAPVEQLDKLLAADNLAVKLLVGQQLQTRFPEELKTRFPAKTAADALRDLADAKHPHLQRAAVDYAIFHPATDFIKPLVELLKATPADDTHLRHATRMALRNQFLGDAKAWEIPGVDAGVVADIAVAIPSQPAAAFLAPVMWNEPDPGRAALFAEHVGRYGEERFIEDFARTPPGGRGAEHKIEVLRGLLRGLQARGMRLSAEAAIQIVTTAADAVKWTTQPDQKIGDIRRQLAAAKLLGELPAAAPARFPFRDYPLARERLAAVVGSKNAPQDLRFAAMEALMRIDPATGTRDLKPLLTDPATPDALLEKIAVAFAGSTDPEARLDARDVLKDSPYRRAVVIATALAGSRAGGVVLLEAVKQGKAPARLLQEKLIVERLRASAVPDLDKRLGDLTKGLQPADQKLAALIKQRTTAFAAAKPDKELGAKLYAKHCAACHKVADQGGKVGPNLDGVGTRGLERLLEDTLDPNRNVDAAFRARVLTLTDGTTKTGLMLRVEGEVVVMADDQGKEFRVPTTEIEANRETALSPMPANFGEVIPEADFAHLVAYLLELRAKDPPPKK